jgi:hypothetical protein
MTRFSANTGCVIQGGISSITCQPAPEKIASLDLHALFCCSVGIPDSVEMLTLQGISLSLSLSPPILRNPTMARLRFGVDAWENSVSHFPRRFSREVSLSPPSSPSVGFHTTHMIEPHVKCDFPIHCHHFRTIPWWKCGQNDGIGSVATYPRSRARKRPVHQHHSFLHAFLSRGQVSEIATRRSAVRAPPDSQSRL